jgi:hypothetical protein
MVVVLEVARRHDAARDGATGKDLCLHLVDALQIAIVANAPQRVVLQHRQRRIMRDARCHRRPIVHLTLMAVHEPSGEHVPHWLNDVHS